KVIQAEWRR
ncbi:hypothetical protein CISIN_1g0082111mg, partial [Citrus sinensis]